MWHKEKYISNNTLLDQTQRSNYLDGNSLSELTAKSVSRVQKHTERLRLTVMTSYFVVAAIVMGVIAIGYRAPEESSAQAASASILEQPEASVDQIAAANVATAVARTTSMSVETNVSSLSISLNTKTELAQTDSAFLSKPQIVSQIGRKSINQYTTKEGDSVQSLAAQFGISEDTIRWANNLTSDSLSPGTQLKILGTTGIIYTVKEGDDSAKLADKYKADKDRIITFNDAELTGLRVGAQIIIPDGILPENERPGYSAPANLASYYSSSTSSILGTSVTIFGDNGYSYGYCTWYAFNRRAELGRPIGSNWGNAVTWASYAAASGFRVDKTPEAGAVLQVGGGELIPTEAYSYLR